jgi:phage shock protein PspC (stress-responsive transcriptional regulator)
MQRLYRSKKERILGGVCAGLGEHLDVDPTVIRLIWAVVTLISFGTGIIVYIVAWIIIPEDDTGGAG